MVVSGCGLGMGVVYEWVWFVWDVLGRSDMVWLGVGVVWLGVGVV